MESVLGESSVPVERGTQVREPQVVVPQPERPLQSDVGPVHERVPQVTQGSLPVTVGGSGVLRPSGPDARIGSQSFCRGPSVVGRSPG